jgi:hypothetical protein
MSYEAQTLIELGVSWCHTQTDTTLMITLNYVTLRPCMCFIGDIPEMAESMEKDKKIMIHTPLFN